MKNYDYLYYFHKSPVTDYKDIENIFNEGLKSWHGYSMGSMLWPVSEDVMNSVTLEEAVKSYCGDDNTCFIIKIPKKYIATYYHRDGTVDCPIPIFKQTDEKIYNDSKTVTILTPHLIRGVYDGQNNTFISNPNYTPIYNPNGLQYADEQIDYFYSANALKWVQYAQDRRKFSYDQLKKIDDQRKTYDAHMQAYANVYPHKTPYLFNGNLYNEQNTRSSRR